MHCISRNLHTLFICVCFFFPHIFIHFFLLLCMNVCMYVEMNKTSMWDVSTYGPSFRYIKDEEHTKENEFHFLFVEITFLCTINAIRWFGSFHRCTYQNRTKYKVLLVRSVLFGKYKVVILLCRLSFWKCEKVGANEIERETGACLCQQLLFCS